jgi:hypothetical protein
MSFAPSPSDHLMSEDAFVQAAATNTVDRGLALLAGRNTWLDRESTPSSVERAANVTKILALGAAVTAVLATSADHDTLRPVPEFVGEVGLILLTAFLSIGALRTALGGRGVARPMWVNLVTRVVASLLFVAVAHSLVTHWWSLVSWPVGVAIGVDAFFTAETIGWLPSPWVSARSVLLSPVHAGLVGGLVGAGITRGGNATFETALPIYVTTMVWVLVAVTTAWAVGRLRQAEAAELEAVRISTVSDEHRRSAHWLHDDIASRLRVVSLRLQHDEPSIPEIAALLDDLDFQLRLRQLDELLSSGTVRLAEVLQPYVRRAQSHGVTVERVPSFETASEQVDAETGRTFRRAAAILTSNSLNAGARHISFDVEVRHDTISVAVTDDAGGFELSEISQGRGLWGLRADLGQDRVHVTPTTDGSTVEIVIDRETKKSPS